VKKNEFYINLSLYETGEEEIPTEEMFEEPTEVAAGAEDLTAEQALSEEEALENVEEQEASDNVIKVTLTDIPQLENMQPGDVIDIVTTYKVLRSGEGGYELEPTDYLPATDVGAPEEVGLEEAAPAGAPGGGIAGALAGSGEGLGL